MKSAHIQSPDKTEINVRANTRHRLIATAVLSIPTILFTALAIPQIKSDRVLRESDHVIEARVTDWQITTKGGKKHDIRYAFTVDGVEASHSDATGRANLWVSIPEDIWHQTKTTRTIDVRYDPGNIFNNLPACKSPSYADTYAALVMGILCFLIIVAIWFFPEGKKRGQTT